MIQEDERRDAQYDPRNKRRHTGKRMNISFAIVVLIFVALGLTAVIIMSHAR